VGLPNGKSEKQQWCKRAGHQRERPGACVLAAAVAFAEITATALGGDGDVDVSTGVDALSARNSDDGGGGGKGGGGGEMKACRV